MLLNSCPNPIPIIPVTGYATHQGSASFAGVMKNHGDTSEQS